MLAEERDSLRTVPRIRRTVSEGRRILSTMEETWFSRDLPILEAVVAICDETGDHADRSHIAGRTRFDDETVKRALFALAAEEPAFFDYSDTSTFAGRGIDFIRDPTGHARRTVGSWPTPENLADRIVAALNEAADEETDPEKQSKLRHAADVGKGAMAGVISTVIAQGM